MFIIKLLSLVFKVVFPGGCNKLPNKLPLIVNGKLLLKSWPAINL